MRQWYLFPPDLSKMARAVHDTAGWNNTARSAKHPANGADCQVIDVPDNTPDKNGVSLFIADNQKPYHGFLLVNDPIGILVDIFPFKPASAPTSARRGLVRLAGRMLLDDDGPFNPLYTTLFWALGRRHNGERDRMKQNFQWARSKGYDGVRILGQVWAKGEWSDIPIDPMWPTYAPELADVIDCAYDECGLRVKLTVIGGGDPDPVGTARKVANVVSANRQHKILLLEPVNERNADVEDVKRMVPILQATGCLVVPGFGDAPIDDIKDLTNETGADGVAYHTERTDGDNGARQVRQCWNFKDFQTMADDGEGPGPAGSVADFPDPFKNSSKAAANKICGASLRCNHTGHGVYGKTYTTTTGLTRHANLWEMPDANAIFDGVRHADDHIPNAIANWRKFNTNHPVEIQSGSVNKLYGAADDATGRAIEIAIGCESSIVLRATRPCGVKLWNPATGEGCGEFRVTVGQSFQPTVPLWCYVIEVGP